MQSFYRDSTKVLHRLPVPEITLYYEYKVLEAEGLGYCKGVDRGLEEVRGGGWRGKGRGGILLCGEVAERLNAAVSKTVMPVTPASGVRIPPSPLVDELFSFSSACERSVLLRRMMFGCSLTLSVWVVLWSCVRAVSSGFRVWLWSWLRLGFWWCR